jgi:hypothetical protein
MGLALVLAALAIPSIVVAVVTYRRARDTIGAAAGLGQRVPRATVVSGDDRWTAGRAVQRIVGRIPSLQAALIAFAAGAIAFMALSVVVIAALIVAA